MTAHQSRRVRSVAMLISFLAAAIPLGFWVEEIGGPRAIVEHYGVAPPLLALLCRGRGG